MPGTSAIIGITVYDTDEITAKQNVSVKLTNNSNGETQTADTDSAGHVIFNLANFDTEWASGDIIEVYALYETTEATSTFQATGALDLSLTLAARTSSAELRYFTTTEFLNTFDMSSDAVDTENGLSIATIQLVGEAQEDHIDRILGQKFDNNGGDYYTATDEYHNVTLASSYTEQTFFTRNMPIVALTSFEVNTAGPDGEADWKTLTEADNEITARYNIGRIEITNTSNYPTDGKDQVRINYTYGYSSVPKDIKRLAILLTAKAMNINTFNRMNIIATEASGLSSTIQNFTNFSKEIESILENRRMAEVHYV